MAKTDVRVVNLSSYEPPKFTDYKPNGKDWILNGKNNINYDYVIDCYRNSTTNATILDSYANMIFGKGLTSNGGNIEAFEKILSKKDQKKVVKDYSIFREACFEVIQGKTGKQIVEANHLPKNKVVPNMVGADGKIKSYWYCYDWNNTSKYPPESIPVHEIGTAEKKSIVVIKEYTVDEFYFARPSYFSALNYAELEKELGIYFINHIQNGLSVGHIINFNDGEPDEEVKDKIEAKVNKKLCGSRRAGTVLLSFNSNKDNATTVEALTVSDAHQQYQFLTEEARKQIMVAHKVTSPILFGIKDNTGFGNNADEMQTAFDELMMNVIPPMQEPLLDAFASILEHNGQKTELEFLPLRPKPEVVEPAENVTPEITEKAELKKVCCSSHSHENDKEIAAKLIELGEDEDLSEWDLVLENEVDYAEEVAMQFASTGTARPNASSAQDGDIYKVRYQYAPLKKTKGSREFCSLMVDAAKIYRKEDIIAMDNIPVNPGWGNFGADTYSIWIFKGGGLCQHKWVRKIYVKKGSNVDVNSPLAELISTTKARQAGFYPEANDDRVGIEPRNMRNQGFLEPR